MMVRILVLLIAALLFPAAGNDLLGGAGRFAALPDGALPAEWSFPEKAVWRPTSADTAVIRDGALLLVNTHPRKGMTLCRTAPLAGESDLLVRAEVGTEALEPGREPWQTARILLDFLDASGKVMPGYRSINLKGDERRFKTVERLVAVPAGAKQLRLSTGFWGGCGRLLIRSLEVLDVSPRRDWAEEAGRVAAPSELTACRSALTLNGIWRIQPVLAGRDAVGEGFLRVPGLWSNTHSWLRPALEGLLGVEPGANWTQKDLREASLVRYRKRIPVPASWKGRRIRLTLDRVSTDAEIRVNGRRAGTASWPGGVVDLTGFLTPGGTAEMEIRVLAAPDREFVEDFTFYDARREKSRVYSRGLAGTVELLALPTEPLLEGVFIQTSVRRRELALDIDLTPVAAGDEARFRFLIRKTGSGRVVKEFRRSAALPPGARLVRFTEPWPDPELWDLRQPNLYTLEVQMEQGGRRDALRERFGFREFRVEGRQLLLNEKPFRMRPVSPEETRTGGAAAVVKKVIGDLFKANFNILELTPHDLSVRGTMLFRPEWCDAADEAGMPLILPVMGFNTLIPWGAFATPETLGEWEKRVVPDWKRFRNHPSAVMLIAGHNRFPTLIDQNPLALGNGAAMLRHATKAYRKLAASGEALMAVLRRIDPTRPAISHHAGAVGDLHTVNMYLNFIPLQEREEYLFEWAKSGDRPFFAVEFGFPITYSLMRGRSCGPGQVAMTEPQLTEYCAIYLGDRVYRQELPEYRRAVKSRHRGNGRYESFHGLEIMGFNPVYQQLLELFVPNTLKSWRAWGMTGGVLPWESASGWTSRLETGFELLPQQRDDGKTPAVSRVPKRFYRQFDPAYLTPAGRRLVAANAPALAWLGGSADNFTRKDHHYYGGETLSKQVIAVNDLRSGAATALTCRILFGGKELKTFSQAGEVPAGSNRFFPVEVKLPEVEEVTSGVVELSGVFGGVPQSDRFEFQVFPRIARRDRGEVAVFDSDGMTRRALEEFGFRVMEYRSGAVPGKVLVIGEKMAADPALPWREAERFTQAGGRVVLLVADPAVWRDRFGLRVSRQVSRLAFPVPTQRNHPVLAGLGEAELRHWRGSSLQTARYAGLDPDRQLSAYPMYGWHVGNTGAVSAGMLEKPHNTGWTPLLEGEFDLAYSPLLEFAAGQGRVMLCTLDLLNRTERDPVADLLLLRLVEYAKAVAASRPRPVFYIGRDDAPAVRQLKRMRLEFSVASRLPASPALAIVGSEAKVGEAEVERFAREGGRVLLLERPAGTFAGLHFAPQVFGRIAGVGTSEAWRGISLSDLHLKTDFTGIGVTPSPAGGLVGERRIGSGVILAMQLLPESLNAEKFDYYKFTRRRLTRLLAQLVANQGGAFAFDRRIFEPRRTAVPLEKLVLPRRWRAEFERRVPSGNDSENRPQDTGNAGIANNWHSPAFDDSAWRELEAGDSFQSQGEYWQNANGVVWYRTRVTIPEGWRGRELMLNLGIVDDMDHTYFNGVEIGRTGMETPHCYNVRRSYRIPPETIRYGEANQIAVRVFDNFGNGGLLTPPDWITIAPPEKHGGEYDCYVNDFDPDWAYGDDPARYFRW